MLGPHVHPSTIVSTLTVTSTIETTYAIQILQDRIEAVLFRMLRKLLCRVVQYPSGSVPLDTPILASYSTSYAMIVSSEPCNGISSRCFDPIDPGYVLYDDVAK